MSTIQKLRCAVYTRKSSEEGLDQEFNSLDAQREACAAFIVSQVGLGWKLVPDRYDDGGISGGTMERPALKRLLADIAARKIDVVVVYKIDRLTRALADFAKIVEVFDANGVSFVSVTQQFNTTTSMGRLTLNVLLSFAQFEREVTAERIRDKIAASKKKGMWMGGTVPLGYRVEARKLMVKEPEASFVRHLFQRYLELRSVPALSAEVTRKAAATAEAGASSPHPQTSSCASDRPYARACRPGMLYKLLSNPLYIGRLKHKDSMHAGEHQPIITAEVFQKVQDLLAHHAASPRGASAHADVHLLTGILFDDAGDRMSPSHSSARGKRYRYYISSRIKGAKRTDTTAWRVPAPELEGTIISFLARLLGDRSKIAEWVSDLAPGSDVSRCITAAGDLQSALLTGNLPVDKRSLLVALVRKVDLGTSAISVTLDVVALMRKLGTSMNAVTEDDEEQHEASITLRLPVTIKRRGNEMRLVIEADQTRSPDSSLVSLIARSHLYLRHLTSGSDISVSDVADHFGVHRADVGRILPLAFLAPKLVDQILTGVQSPELSARRLARDNLPLLWADQITAFG